mgnify:CR=1 FL=1
MTKKRSKRKSPGLVRDTILTAMHLARKPMTVAAISQSVKAQIGSTSYSSIRSYLGLNTPKLFVRQARGLYRIRSQAIQQLDIVLPSAKVWEAPISVGGATLYHSDCFEWLERQKDNSIHAVVTDPPYGLYEYSPEQQLKLRAGRGGVWRIPPSYDGHKRSQLPSFTTLTPEQLERLRIFFVAWSKLLLLRLVPGANIVVASNPLLSYIVSSAMAESGLERRGEIIRLTMTMRGGDRPKAAHKEFAGVSVMPRSMWEPWLVFRKPIEGRVQDNLRKWRTGGFRRPSSDKPFGDVIASSPTRTSERKIAPHPSLKPQRFLRQIVRAVLPLGEGTILDPFAGSGSTLAAAEACGYQSIGIESDETYFHMAAKSILRLSLIQVGSYAKT